MSTRSVAELKAYLATLPDDLRLEAYQGEDGCLVVNDVNGSVVGPPEPSPESLTPAELIAAGYIQTSNRFRTVACVPSGKTAVQALEEADDSWKRQHEEMAKNFYCRVHAKGVTLSQEDFAEFRRLSRGDLR